MSFVGGLLGLAVGFSGVRLLLSISPGDIPRIGENGSAIGLDYRVLLFTLGISLLTGVLFGLVPAISASRPDLTTSLNENSSRSGMGLRHGNIRSLLVVSEIALALVLVIGAALLIRTFLKLEEVNPGFTTHNVLSASMSISGSRFQKNGTRCRDRPRRPGASHGCPGSARRGRKQLPAAAGLFRDEL